MKRFVDDYHDLLFDYSVKDVYNDDSVHVNVWLAPESGLLHGGDKRYTAHYCAKLIGDSLNRHVRSFNEGNYK
jgi:hypothetical protein